MAAQGRGGGNTPKRLVIELRKKVEGSSQSAVARETGLTQSAIGRYIKGIGEPSDATLQILADYLKMTVAELRGDPRVFEVSYLISLGGRDKIFEYLVGQGFDEEIATELSKRVIRHKAESLDYDDGEGNSEKSFIGEIVRENRHDLQILPSLSSVINRCRTDDKFCKALKEWLNSVDHPEND